MMPTAISERLVSWASDIDPATTRQAEKAARLPIVEGHVTLMPDAHLGIGATVGSVFPTRDAVIPCRSPGRGRSRRTGADLVDVGHTLRQILNYKGT